MTRPAGRPALYRDALGGQDGTQAPNLRFRPATTYWDPTLSTAPRTAAVMARPVSAVPLVIDPALFIAPVAGPATAPPAAQPWAIPPAAPIPRRGTAAVPRQTRPAAPPAEIRPAAPMSNRMAAPPPIAWPAPGTSQAWSASAPAVAPVPGTGYRQPALPVGPPSTLHAVQPVGQQATEANSQQVLRDAMRAFGQQQQRTPQSTAANRSSVSAKGCVSAIFWIVLLIVVGVLLKSGTLNDLINQIFR